MRTVLLITTFNRPIYLKQCLESIGKSDLSKIDEVLVIDDASTDPDVSKIVLAFIDDKPNWTFVVEQQNKGIKNSLMLGCNIIFQKYDLVINLDADAIVRSDFVEKILEVKTKYPELICTGFNCNTLNRDGSIRHKILFSEKICNFKRSVGGINMCFNKEQYHKWVKPSLQELNSNWDHCTCLRSAEESLPIACVTPSVIQHIGYSSSLGHDAGGEPPDTASDFLHVEQMTLPIHDEPIFEGKPAFGYTYREKERWKNGRLQLPEVTLICADGWDVDRCIHAANISCRNIDFGAVKILTHLYHEDPRVIKIKRLSDKIEYSQFILKEIVNYVDTPYLLIFQYDGFILNANAWDDEFLKYDMIGATWKFRPEKRTANGGFSLRSKSMCEKIARDNHIFLQNDHLISNFAEDHVLFYIYRDHLENNHKVKIAPEELCDKFSIEAWGVPPPGNKYTDQFGFHGFSVEFNDAKIPYVPYRLPSKTIL